MRLLIWLTVAAMLFLFIMSSIQVGFVVTVGITALAVVGFSAFGLLLVRAFDL